MILSDTQFGMTLAWRKPGTIPAIANSVPSNRWHDPCMMESAWHGFCLKRNSGVNRFCLDKTEIRFPPLFS